MSKSDDRDLSTFIMLNNEIDRLKGEVRQEQGRGDRFLEKYALEQRETKKLKTALEEIVRKPCVNNGLLAVHIATTALEGVRDV